ncbi:hypothetical protein SUS17_299 [Sphingomonas sp. S17]|nr:hypothetical protein SUS17_299 [Sphingomonas sp. S17]
MSTIGVHGGHSSERLMKVSPLPRPSRLCQSQCTRTGQAAQRKRG